MYEVNFRRWPTRHPARVYSSAPPPSRLGGYWEWSLLPAAAIPLPSPPMTAAEAQGDGAVGSGPSETPFPPRPFTRPAGVTDQRGRAGGSATPPPQPPWLMESGMLRSGCVGRAAAAGL